MNDLKLGDVTFKDDKNLGFSAYIDGKQVLWINAKGELPLFNWLEKKITGRMSKEITEYVSKNKPSPGPKGNPPRGEKNDE